MSKNGQFIGYLVDPQLYTSLNQKIQTGYVSSQFHVGNNNLFQMIPNVRADGEDMPFIVTYAMWEHIIWTSKVFYCSEQLELEEKSISYTLKLSNKLIYEEEIN